MTELYNASIRDIPMPDRIKRLPVSITGYPVPWFVQWFDGVADFRVIDSRKIGEAVKKKRCWVCGDPLGKTFAMTLGPMCAINRTISEPPSHRECAIFSVTACPFLSKPRMRRNEVGLPEGHSEPAGNGLKRNPGAAAVWLTRGYRPFRADGGILFTFDDPEEVLWFAEGRTATRDEVLHSIVTGLPMLEAEAVKDGPRATDALKRMIHDAMRYLPA